MKKINSGKFKMLPALLCIGAVLLSGCGGTDSEGGISPGSPAKGSGSAVSAGAQATVTTLDTAELFTNRDREIGYDEDSCERIELAGEDITITKEGAYLLSGELKGSVTVDAGKKDKVQLILDGASVICDNGAALYVKQADKVFVTTAADSENLLRSNGEFTQTDAGNIDGAIFAKDDITFNGAGILKIVCEAGHGIVCKDDLAVTSGTYEITAGRHGMEGKDSVRILSGAFVIEAAQDGIHSGNDEDDEVGYTYIGGGDIVLKAGDDGIHSETQLVIAGGNITVTESYEGLEGKTVEITDGTINVKARDDGLNAAGGKDGSGMQKPGKGGFGKGAFDVDEKAAIILSGGTLTVDAEGDGLDSNGALQVNGGVIVVHGPTIGANGALDYGSEAVITGGTVIALGASGMAENFGESSTQPSILINVQAVQKAGTAAVLKDSSGREILSCISEKSYNSVVFSSPDLQVGQTYTVALGDQVTEVKLDEMIYGHGMGMGGKGGFGKPGDFEDRGNRGERGKAGRFGKPEDGQFPEPPSDGQFPEPPRL